MPLEEHVLWAASVAKRYLEGRLDLLRGRGVRQAAARRGGAQRHQRRPDSRARATWPPARRSRWRAALGDETLPHIPWPEFSFGVVVSGPEEMRKAVRMFLKYGVDTIKLNLSGDNFVPAARARDDLDDRRGGRHRGARRCTCAASASPPTRAPASRSSSACATASRSSTTPASPTRRRSTCSRRTSDKHFVAPGIGILYAMLNEAEPWGITRQKAIDMGYEIEWAAACESLRKMHKRGIRVLPGGDYGFAFTPHCQNARDLEFFVKYLGFTPMEALLSATQLRRRDHDEGRRAGPDQGGLSRRPAAGGRRPVGQSRASCASPAACWP